jgi:SPP1 gp7 family putative phage head morphogenesis protein
MLPPDELLHDDRDAAAVRAADDAVAVKAVEDIFADTDVWETIRQTMVEIVRPIFLEAFLVGAELGAAEAAPSGTVDPASVETSLGFRALPQDAARIALVAESFVDGYTDNWWRQFSVSTQNGLRRAINRSMRDGTGVQGVLAGIQSLFGAERAKLIAVSETTNLMGGGAIETYRQAGYEHWEWRTTNDSHVDRICRGLNRKTFPITLPFERAHPGCRCWPVPAGQPRPPLTPFLPVQGAPGVALGGAFPPVPFAAIPPRDSA